MPLSVDVEQLQDRITSLVSRTGTCERVNGHEPKSAPGNGVTAAVWLDDIRPLAPRSGLMVTSARLLWRVRFYLPMLRDQQDSIDPALTEAVTTTIADLSADFTLGGSVGHVDLLGAHGEPLSARAGYLSADQKMFRVFDLALPLVLDNVWEQRP